MGSECTSGVVSAFPADVRGQNGHHTVLTQTKTQGCCRYPRSLPSWLQSFGRQLADGVDFGEGVCLNNQCLRPAGGDEGSASHRMPGGRGRYACHRGIGRRGDRSFISIVVSGCIEDSHCVIFLVSCHEMEFFLLILSSRDVPSSQGGQRLSEGRRRIAAAAAGCFRPTNVSLCCRTKLTFGGKFSDGVAAQLVNAVAMLVARDRGEGRGLSVSSRSIL